jgi:hypothetical protein
MQRKCQTPGFGKLTKGKQPFSPFCILDGISAYRETTLWLANYISIVVNEVPCIFDEQTQY